MCVCVCVCYYLCDYEEYKSLKTVSKVKVSNNSYFVIS